VFAKLSQQKVVNRKMGLNTKKGWKWGDLGRNDSFLGLNCPLLFGQNQFKSFSVGGK
jgi:hypothetical protein